MKRALAGVAGAIALAVFVVTFWGMYLPDSTETTARATVQAAVNTVWSVLGEPEDRARWWGDVERIERVDAEDPARLSWREHYKDGSSRSFQRTNYYPPRAQAYVARARRGVVDEWTIQVLPGDEGTRVALTRNRVVENPVIRFFNHFFSNPARTGQEMVDALSEHVRK